MSNFLFLKPSLDNNSKIKEFLYCNILHFDLNLIM